MEETRRERRKGLCRKSLAVFCILVLVMNGRSAEAAAKAPSLAKKTLTMAAGESYTMKLLNKPKNAVLRWSSGNKKLVTVTSKGVIRAVKKGDTVITCTWKQGKKKIVQKCKVKVAAPAFQPGTITVTKGTSKKIAFQYKPLKAAYSWSSSNKKVASVSGNGTVKGIKKGTVTIQCRITAGKTRYTLKKTVKVVEKKPAPTKEPDNPGTGGGSSPGGDPGTGGGSNPGGDPGTGGGSNPGGDPGTGGGGSNPGGDGPGGGSAGTEPGGHDKPDSSWVVYEYDALGRLIYVRYEDGSGMEYQYDANGNITSIIKHVK